MMVKKGRAAASLLAMGALVFSGSALATNGYFTHGVGAASKGMAGTGVGSNADMGAIMTASNPALGVFVDDSWEAGLSIFSPRRSYEAFESQLNGGFIPIPGCDLQAPDPALCLPSHTIAEGKIDSSSEWFPIPYVAKNWSLQNGGNITGAFYGRGGMNTDWDDGNASATSYFCGADPNTGAPLSGPGPYCAGNAGVDLMQAFFSVTYSAQVNENFAWGIGPVIALQSFEAKGVQTFQAVSKTCVSTLQPDGSCTLPTNLSGNGHDTTFGFGFTGGVWFGLSDAVSFGLSYTSKMSMDEFDDYADLYAEAGGFDIPASIKAGISWLASDTLRVNFDIENTGFDDVDSVGNPMANLFSCPVVPAAVRPSTDIESCLGGGNGAGFGWDDMTTYKVGFEWQQDETNTWRFGYSYGEQPVQEDDVLFNILAPGVMEQHITFGLTHRTASGSAWDFSFMYAPENEVRGISAFDPTQEIEVSMDQLEFEIAYTF